jgi:hypothetical protein
VAYGCLGVVAGGVEVAGGAVLGPVVRSADLEIGWLVPAFQSDE